MKHLFIINPVAEKIRGRVSSVIEEINGFFNSNTTPSPDFSIHVTRWARDAVGYIRRYAFRANELVRIHVFGGSGTLFEALNGVVGLPNTQLAAYPMGKNNYFLRYFGDERIHMFGSIRNQVFSGAIPIDAIRCGNNFALSHGLIGMEAVSTKDGTEMNERMRLPLDTCYLLAIMKNIVFNRNISQRYRLDLDGYPLDGGYISLMVANTPSYSNKVNPAPDAHPNDGILDLYLVREASRRKSLYISYNYFRGRHHKAPDVIHHYKGIKLSVSSDEDMFISMDGEMFFENNLDFELIPYAADFVCPAGIDVSKLPHSRKSAEKGWL